MQHQNQDMKKPAQSKENTEKLNKKIKETWSGLSDSDVKLYADKPAEFFAKLQEKHNVPKADAQKKLQQLEKECGCCPAKAA